MAPRIAILGANGQVGWELQRALQPLGRVWALNRAQAPLNDLPKLQAALDSCSPHIIVNAAAYTAVDTAEADTAAAHAINTSAVAFLAQRAAERRELLVHYSTDYVFDGSGDHFRAEDEPTNPLSVYGATKLAGELALTLSGCAHLCLRTSWVYAARGGNFAKTMLRLGAEREALNVVNDQFGAPTGADLIADTTAQMLGQIIAKAPKEAFADDFDELLPGCQRIHSFLCYKTSSDMLGTYHLVAAGATHWRDYASHAIELARSKTFIKAHTVTGIPSAQYPTPAKRPANSRLSTAKLQRNFGLHMPHWHVGVERLVNLIYP